MTSRTRWLAPVVALLIAVSWLQAEAHAQFNRGGAVGGVAVDSSGVLRVMSVQDRAKLVEQFRNAVKGAPDGLAKTVPTRRISLRGLEAACRDFVTAHPGEPLPDELQYMGGLLHVEYVMVYPEQNDIVIAGPAEGWHVNDQGTVVGVTTGLPVMHLEDFVIAMRNVDRGIEERITCSIDPTPEGQQRLAQLMAQQKQIRSRLAPAQLAAAVKQAYGPQIVRVTGIPATSRFAHVMVAADYRMKRIAMGLDPAPIAKLPSYVQLLAKNPSSVNNSQPRWWLAPNFGSVTRSDDGLAFAIEKPGVRVMTEDEYVAADGSLKRSGRKSKAAEDFAAATSARYAELAKADTVFAELRNLMELSVVAAIIERHDLLAKSGASLPLLTSIDRRLPTTMYQTPKTVSAECTIMRVRGGLLVTASGGVEIDAWELAAASQTRPRVSQQRQRMLMNSGTAWWAN